MKGELKYQKGKEKDNEVMMLELKELVSFWNTALPGHTEGRGAT